MPRVAAAENIQSAFDDLHRNVRTVVRIHAGNQVKLDIERDHVSRFLAMLNQVRVSSSSNRNLFTPG
jgi:sRNA-binding regulator protein Hfq